MPRKYRLYGQNYNRLDPVNNFILFNGLTTKVEKREVKMRVKWNENRRILSY